MADSINATGGNSDIKQIYVNWKQLTAKEVIQKGEEGQDAPTEILKWAEEVSKISNAPDDVTYDIAQGETDIEKLNELVNPELAIPKEENNEIAKEEQQQPQENIFIPETETGLEAAENTNEPTQAPPLPNAAQQTDTKAQEQQKLTLADNTITTDANEIIKRKERKGLS